MKPIVIELGSSGLKFGYGGDEGPRVIVAYPLKDCMEGNIAIKDGRVVDADRLAGEITGALARLSSRSGKGGVVQSSCGVPPCADLAIMSVSGLSWEGLAYAHGLRNCVEKLFSEGCIKRLQIVSNALASLYGASYDTGLLLDMGFNCCRVTPVTSSELLPSACRESFPEGGFSVTTRLQRLMEMSCYGPSLINIADAEALKRVACFVPPDHLLSLQLQTDTTVFERVYRMPDGQQLPLGSARFQCAEKTFFVNTEHGSLVDTICETLQRVPVDLRRKMVANIVLAGGSSMLPGLPERLHDEIPQAYASQVLRQAYQRGRVAVNVCGLKHREHLAFRGSSIIATLDSSQENPWKGWEEFQERGLRAFVQRSAAL